MDDKKQTFDNLKGVTPIDYKMLEGFKREMTEKVVPEIVKIVEERQLLAQQSRHRRLDVLAAPKKAVD